MYLCKTQICVSCGNFSLDFPLCSVICCLCWAAFGLPFYAKRARFFSVLFYIFV